MATASLVSAAALATGAYLDAKLGIGVDLRQISYERESQARLEQRLRDLGDTCSLYRMFEMADPGIEALWFEGRTWTYGQLKTGEYHRLILLCLELPANDGFRGASVCCLFE
jgi:hypothetical protein